MKLLKLDFGAETRPLERYIPRGKGEWYEVDCPFCGRNQLVQTRKFHQGVRCDNPDCRAMLRFCTHDATRDLLPRELTVMVHGMRTRLSYTPATPNASLEEAFGIGTKEGGAE